ncbi:MAG: hypothetical protein PVH19_00045 [Planctomycetia bacterium]|jgi:hypothetical protein
MKSLEQYLTEWLDRHEEIIQTAFEEGCADPYRFYRRGYVAALREVRDDMTMYKECYGRDAV